MTKITIKKTGEEITYSNITTTHTFEVNGKEVHVYTYDKQDMTQSEYDSGEDIEERDLEALTDEEHEAFGEVLNDHLALKVGEQEIIDNEE